VGAVVVGLEVKGAWDGFAVLGWCDVGCVCVHRGVQHEFINQQQQQQERESLISVKSKNDVSP